jgi:hypothetical protein
MVCCSLVSPSDYLELQIVDILSFEAGLTGNVGLCLPHILKNLMYPSILTGNYCSRLRPMDPVCDPWIPSATHGAPSPSLIGPQVLHGPGPVLCWACTIPVYPVPDLKWKDKDLWTLPAVRDRCGSGLVAVGSAHRSPAALPLGPTRISRRSSHVNMRKVFATTL